MSEGPQPALLAHTAAERAAECAKIDLLSHEDMARLWRFAPPGHPWFDSHQAREVFEHLQKRFNASGGMTVGVSKIIGWDAPVPLWSKSVIAKYRSRKVNNI
jgi:hypothetical protein